MSWSTSWSQVSSEFRSRADSLGAQERHPLGGVAPDGRTLTLDVALLGPQRARRCVIVSAGLHGVEGVAGSAILRAWLRDHAKTDTRLVLLHMLNPFGFAYGRRVDQDNIDLNRNFLLQGQRYDEVPHHSLDWLAPERPPSRVSWLLPRLLLARARMGDRALRAAVAGGQSTNSKGLFYGGSGPSALQTLLGEHLPRWIAGADRILHLDLHTGLGTNGQLQLLLPRIDGSPEARALVARFGKDAVPAQRDVRHFRTTGALGPWCEALLSDVHYTLCAAEFGTTSALNVLSALHQENRAHFFGQGRPRTSAWARRRLVDAFAPQSESWRRQVLARGIRLIDEALASAPVSALKKEQFSEQEIGSGL